MLEARKNYTKEDMHPRIKVMLETFTPEEIQTGMLESKQSKTVKITTPTELERTFKAELLARNAGTLLRQAREAEEKA